MGENAYVDADDLRLLLAGWWSKSGMKPRSGLDPAGIEAAAQRLRTALVAADTGGGEGSPDASR